MSTIADYTKQERGPYLVERWHRKTPAVTPYGEFEVELVTDMDDEPDAEQLRLGDAAVAFVESEYRQIAEIAFGYFQWCLKTWGEEIVFTEEPFDGEPVPRDVSVDTILAAFSRAGISIHHSEEIDEGVYESTIGFAVPFDPEHGLRMELKDGKITGVNDSPFRMWKGKLVFDHER